MELSIFVPLMTLTSGRRISALKQMRTEALAMGLPDIVTRIDHALTHDQQTREYDNQWASPTRRSLYTPEVGELDNLTDIGITSFRDIARAQVRGLPEIAPLVASTDAMLADVFPAGAKAIISLPYIEQVAACEVIVMKLKTRWLSTVGQLGLHGRLAYLAEHTEKYRIAIDQRRNLTFATVQKWRTGGQNNLRKVVIAILAEHMDDDDPAEAAARARLLDPLLEQIEEARTAARLRRAGSKQDDADSGDGGGGDGDGGDGVVGDGDVGDGDVGDGSAADDDGVGDGGTVDDGVSQVQGT